MKKLALVLSVALLPLTVHAAEVDAEAAQALLKKSDCFKCHAIDKKKDGTPYREVAKKYKGKPDAEDKLYTHVTTGPKVKLEDGSEEEHKIIKSKSEPEIRNVIKWILSL